MFFVCYVLLEVVEIICCYKWDMNKMEVEKLEQLFNGGKEEVFFVNFFELMIGVIGSLKKLIF